MRYILSEIFIILIIFLKSTFNKFYNTFLYPFKHNFFHMKYDTKIY